MSYDRNEDKLIGNVLTGIKIAEDREALLLQFEDGEAVVRCDGDCCSTTWVESVELPARGFPAVIQSIEDLDMGKPDSWEEPDKECVAFYGCKIVTDNGDIVIDYRNESNGYYGGNLAWPGDYHYGGVYGQNNSKDVWVDLP